MRVCSSCLSAASIVAVHAQLGPGVMIMSKTQRSNKESKKQATLTAKERKAAKRDKKKSGGHVPFVVKDTWGQLAFSDRLKASRAEVILINTSRSHIVVLFYFLQSGIKNLLAIIGSVFANSYPILHPQASGAEI